MTHEVLKQIEDAIANSIATDSVSHIVFPIHPSNEKFTIDELVDVISETQGYLVDYTEENNGSYDVWGWTNATKKDQTDWRINIFLSTTTC